MNEVVTHAQNLIDVLTAEKKNGPSIADQHQELWQWITYLQLACNATLPPLRKHAKR